MTSMQDVAEERRSERQALIAELEMANYLTDPLVEEAMLAVPRHLFVPPEVRAMAYEDRPLPLAFNQTISAPHMVAMMTCALDLKPGDKVLEIGTGAGYHAAIAKKIVGDDGLVVSIEYLPELAQLARENLKLLGIDVRVIAGDGADGCPDDAPFDAVYVTCAIPEIPDQLISQVRDGGHFVAPVGVTRCSLLAGPVHKGEFKFTDLGPCLFVNVQGRMAPSDLPESDEH